MLLLLLILCTIGAIHNANTYWKHLSTGFTAEYWDLTNVTVSKFLKYLVFNPHLIAFLLLCGAILFLSNLLGIPVLEIFNAI